MRIGAARVWSAATGKLARTVASDGQVLAVAWAPDGRTMALARADATVQLTGAASGSLTQFLRGRHGPVTDVTYAPDGASLATAGADGRIRIWDARSGTLRMTLTGHQA